MIDSRATDALGRRPSNGTGQGGGSAYTNTPGEQRAAAMTCADHAVDAAELRLFLAELGLDR